MTVLAQLRCRSGWLATHSEPDSTRNFSQALYGCVHSKAVNWLVTENVSVENPSDGLAAEVGVRAGKHVNESAQLAIFTAAPVIAASLCSFAIMSFLTRYAKANPGDSVAACC
jgi:hypothetical protein